GELRRLAPTRPHLELPRRPGGREPPPVAPGGVPRRHGRAMSVSGTRAADRLGGREPPLRTGGDLARRWQALLAPLTDPMYRNAVALAANTAITSVLGVAYWVLA